MTYSEKKQQYRQAVSRAVQWLVDHQEADGGLGALQTMSASMVVPASLLFCGRPEEAARHIQWQRHTYVKPEGGFDPPEIRAGRASSLAERPYGPAWMIYSGHVNLAYDISLRALPSLLAMQDPATGGMFGRAEEAAEGRGIVNTAVTAVACQAAYTAGAVEAARRMADHLCRVIHANDWQSTFYPAWDTERGLRTDDELAPTGNMPRRIDRYAADQHHHLTGALIAILSDVYAITREPKYLDAARQVFEFVAGAPRAVLRTTLAHKLAWGSAWFFRETSDPRCLEVACEICDHLISGQEADGSFVHWALIRDVKDWPYSSRVNLTAQFALWLERASQCL